MYFQIILGSWGFWRLALDNRIEYLRDRAKTPEELTLTQLHQWDDHVVLDSSLPTRQTKSFSFKKHLFK